MIGALVVLGALAVAGVLPGADEPAPAAAGEDVLAAPPAAGSSAPASEGRGGRGDIRTAGFARAGGGGAGSTSTPGQAPARSRPGIASAPSAGGIVPAAVAGLPNDPELPAAALSSGPPAYRQATGAKAVKGGLGMEQATPPLSPGVYTDHIGRDQTRYYAVRLDGSSDVHLSAVAAPAPGTTVEGHDDALSVSLRDSHNRACGATGHTRFEGAGMTYPVAASAVRRADDPSAPCHAAGVYYLVVERKASLVSAAEQWPLELRVLNEPALRDAAPKAPTALPTDRPPLPDGTARSTEGGTGFNDATAIGSGVWRDHVEPGQTLFYRVPVDWGQRLQVDAEFDGAARSASPLLDGWGLNVYNPAREAVGRGSFVTVDGSGDHTGLVTAPVAYGNRDSADPAVTGASLAGAYYLAVSLSPEAARQTGGAAGLTLRVNVLGDPGAAPGYASATKVFRVTTPDKGVPAGHGGSTSGGTPATGGTTGGQGAAGRGGAVPGAAGAGTTDTPLRLAGWTATATGAALLAVLAAWTLMARRSARRARRRPGQPG